MASLIGSIKNMAEDPWCIVKLGVITAAYFFLRNQEHIYNPVLDEQRVLLFQAILLAVMLGIGVIAMHRNIKNESPFFPGPLNIFDILLKSIFAVIVATPGIFLGYALFSFLSNNFTFDLTVTIIVYTIATAIVSPFIFIPLVLMSVRGNPIDALRLNNLFIGAGNYIVQALSYAIQYVIIIGGITICLYFFLMEMLGDHPALLVLQCFIIVLTFFSFLSYSSDLYGEAIPEIKLSEDTKKPRNLQKKKKKESELASKHEEKMKENQAKRHHPNHSANRPGTRPANRPIHRPKPPEVN